MLLFAMKTIINHNQLIIIFEKEIIDDLSVLHKNISNVKITIKQIILDLRHVKYVSSIFIDYIDKYADNIEKKNIKLKLINCPENIYNLFTKSIAESPIEIKLKDV